MNGKGLSYPVLAAVVVCVTLGGGLLLNRYYPLSLSPSQAAGGNKPVSSVAKKSTPARATKNAGAVSARIPAGAKRIPAQVYRQNKPTDTWADVFFGDEKLALLITAPGCPYRAKYRQNFEWTMRQPEYANAYRQKIIVTPQSFTISGNSPYNAQNYLLENCMGRVCVIEPRKRWIATVDSQDFSQAARMLRQFEDE